MKKFQYHTDNTRKLLESYLKDKEDYLPSCAPNSMAELSCSAEIQRLKEELREPGSTSVGRFFMAGQEQHKTIPAPSKPKQNMEQLMEPLYERLWEITKNSNYPTKQDRVLTKLTKLKDEVKKLEEILSSLKEEIKDLELE